MFTLVQYSAGYAACWFMILPNGSAALGRAPAGRSPKGVVYDAHRKLPSSNVYPRRRQASAGIHLCRGCLSTAGVGYGGWLDFFID